MASFFTVMLRPLEQNETRFTYKFFGLLFESNLSLPRITAADPARNYDVALNLGFSPYSKAQDQPSSEELTYVSSDTDEDGVPLLRIWNVECGAFARMMFADGTQFWLDKSHAKIWATWPSHLSLENTASYLLGPVLGVMLRRRGVVCLHASAVSIQDRAVVFVGPPGAGKSTAAAACSQRGHAIVSDDIVALNERNGAFHVVAALPQVRLWPESVEMLYGGAEALPRFNPTWDKRHLGSGDLGTRFENRSLVLGAVYVLGKRRSDPAPLVQPLRSQEALLSLLVDSYAAKTLDREMRAKEFEVLGNLAANVPIRRLYPHNDIGRIQDLCSVVEKDLSGLVVRVVSL